MPVNLNPPPLPNPDTIRAAAATTPTDDAAPSGDAFAQLIVAAGTLSPSGTARPQKEGRDEHDAKVPVDPVSPDALAIDWAALAMRIATPDSPAVPIPVPTRIETRPAVGRTGERLPSILGAKVDPADAAAPLVTPPGREPATTPDTHTANGAGTPPSPLAVLQTSAVPPVAQAFTAAASPFTDAGVPASKATTADAAPRDSASPRQDRFPPLLLQAPVAAVANAIVRDERQPGGVARDQATAALDAAAIHAEAMTAPHAAAPVPPAVVTIDSPVGQPGFAEEVAGKLVHVVLRQDRAELRLNPAELGPVQIRIDVDGSNTQLTIVATQPATREALEHALPHLRELLASHGIALGQASVHDGRAQDRAPGAPWAPADAGDEARGALPPPVLVQGRIGLSDRLIDTFV